jgi:hypothetical protein
MLKRSKAPPMRDDQTNIRQMFERVAHCARWDHDEQLEALIGFLELHGELRGELRDHLGLVGGGDTTLLAQGMHHLEPVVFRASCDREAPSEQCCGWGVARTATGMQIVPCITCCRFTSTAEAVAHLLACGHCYSEAARFREDHGDQPDVPCH